MFKGAPYPTQNLLFWMKDETVNLLCFYVYAVHAFFYSPLFDLERIKSCHDSETNKKSHMLCLCVNCEYVM